MGMIWVYLVLIVTFLAVDAIALKYVIYPLFSRHVGDLFADQMQFGVALGFYAFYVAGVIYLVVQPALAEGALSRAVLNGAVLGFLAYGTYEATNMATLRGWSWAMVLTDVTWGTLLTAGLGALGYLVARAVI